MLSKAVFAFIVLLFSAGDALAATYYVSTSGNDANSGSQGAPFSTFSKAISVLNPGDSLLIFGGTYNQGMQLTKSGTESAPINISAVSGQNVLLDAQNNSGALITVPATTSYVNISKIGVTRSNTECVLLRGSHINLNEIDAFNCREFGYRITGGPVTIENSKCRDSVTENLGGTNTTGGWGSCLKSGPGSNNLVIRNNEIFHNWGEGLIIGQAAGAEVYGNRVYDNFSQNIYIGNAYDIDVYNNITYSEDPRYYRSGNPANCISASEESISAEWGARLANIRVFNNLARGCKVGMGYTYKEVANNGCANCLFAFNTIVDAATGVKIIDGTKNSVTIKNNIISGGISVPSGTVVTNNITVDPKFATLPGTDPASFRLSSNSPAIGAGAAISGIDVDFEGKTRGNQVDAGAIEYSVSSPASPMPSTTLKPGDANGDNSVDGVDYVVWLNHYGQNASGNSNGDFNGSGFVDGIDYVIWLNNYGK